MKISRELVLLLLENNADWATSPKGLLDIILMIDHLTQNDPAEANWNIPTVPETALELGDSFLKAIPLNISPYKDFLELSDTYVPGDHLRKKMEIIVRMIDQDQDIHRLAKETGISPSKDTLKAEKAMRLIVNGVIDKWSKYVDFEE